MQVRCSTLEEVVTGCRQRYKTMRIAIDIDSTLHHYWNVLSDAARRRFGVELPYEEQLDWGITRLRPDQLHLCIQETHCDAAILAGEPYAGAVETVRGWHDAGHVIHVTSHRDPQAHATTARWLEQIALPYDELYCAHDKVGHCVQAGIELLIDDSPENLARAIEHGIAVATISHPWNRELCETEDVVCGADWAELGAGLEALLRRTRAKS
jgi:uncharacterized HAD superfamily protein